MFKKIRTTAQLFSLVITTGSVLFSPVAFAQTNPNNPGGGGVIVPTGSAAPLASGSTKFSLDMTACRATFDWDKFIIDYKAGRTNSAPYIDQECVSQPNIAVDGTVATTKYSDFTVGSAATKAAFGNDAVVGVFPNGSYQAQGNVGNVNRAQKSSLSNIFNNSELSQIFSTTNGTVGTGMPRVFSTGPDSYTTNSAGQQVYQGGWCSIVNGQITVRTKRAGQDFDPSLYGRDPATPSVSCARTVNGTKLPNVEDQSLRVYQFVYEIKYPTAAQCNTWFGVDATTCNTFYQNRLGRDLAGESSTTTGNRIVYTYTFFGSFDDQYSRFVGWKNPDVNGPRRSSTDAFVRNYDGYSVFEMN